MINGASLRTLFESEGAAGFVRKTRELLGLARDEYGRPTIRGQKIRPDEFSLRELAEAILGPESIHCFAPGAERVNLMEMDTATVPSAFSNTNAFAAATGGLLEAKLLEGFQRPGFIADQLVRTLPTKQRSDRMPGVAAVGDKATAREPGNPHARAQLSERYVTTPETTQQALAIDVTKETVFFDLTRDVLNQAEQVGYWLGLNKEKRVLDTVLGINNTYTYGGTNYDTYLTSGNWVNQQSQNFADWTDVDSALQLFAEMTDQESGEHLLIVPDTVLVMPFKAMTAEMVFSYDSIERRTGSSSEIGRAANPLMGRYNVLASPVAYQRLTDADGGGLSSAAAKQYWYLGEFQRAFAYMENWSLDVRRANAADYHMLDHGLLLSVFANEMGAPAVVEPRYVVRSINE